MDYKLDISNFTDIYIDKTFKNSNNIIKHEFNIKSLLKNSNGCIHFEYLANTILIFNTYNIKLYCQYIHLPSNYPVKKTIYNNEILILERNLSLKIYQDNGNDNNIDYEFNNIIIYEIKNTHKLNFTLKQSIRLYSDYIDANIGVNTDIVDVYNTNYNTNYETNYETKCEFYAYFIEICDIGYSHIIYKFIIKTHIDIEDKIIKIKSFDIIFYYKVKKISKKKYELTLVKFYNDIDSDYIECNFNNIYDITFIEQIKYYIDKIENYCDKSMQTCNTKRPMDSGGAFSWYCNFDDIIRKYKLYDNVVFFNLSWYNKYNKYYR